MLNNEYLRLLLSCLVMTMAVFLIYSLGLAICAPFLLIGYSYYYESSLLNRQSRSWGIDEGKINRDQINDYLFLGNFILNVLVPAVFIQVTYFLFYYYTAELSPALYDLLSFLKTNMENNNSYFVELYQKLPMFGFKKDFILIKEGQEVYIYNATLFFLFYFVTIATFIVGLVGSLFRLRDKNYSRLAIILYTGGALEGQEKTKNISLRAFGKMALMPLIFVTAPIYLAWLFQEEIFDTKRSSIMILAIYLVSPMFQVFYYYFLFQLREANRGNK